jgi:hypothetical protein
LVPGVAPDAAVFSGVVPLWRPGWYEAAMKKELTIAGAGLLVFIGLGFGAGAAMQPAKVTPAVMQSAVTRSPELMERAWQLPAAATFARKLDAQTNGSSCGPSSLANIFRSLGEAATNEAAVLKDTGKCLTGMCFMGLTLDDLAGVARTHTKRKVTVLRDLTPEAFREHLLKSNDPARRYIVNFTRKNIFGGGGGHHSPIGGYLEDKDLVFVLDVNADYGPWLIERPRLFAALDTLDGANKRGLLQIE